MIEQTIDNDRGRSTLLHQHQALNGRAVNMAGSSQSDQEDIQADRLPFLSTLMKRYALSGNWTLLKLRE